MQYPSLFRFLLFVLSDISLAAASLPVCYSLDRPAKSARTAIAARAPSSMAPSMKLRHPNAQSEHANTMLRSLALISFKCVDIKPGAGKNLEEKVMSAMSLTQKKRKGEERRFWCLPSSFCEFIFGPIVEDLNCSR
jgi:hypothetical protein